MRPLITEKSSAAYQERGEYTFEVHPKASKPQIRTAIEQLFGVKVTGVWTLEPARQGEARGEDGRTPPELEKGDRDAPRGRHDRDLRGLTEP